ncbi:phosphotransferase [Lichenicola cladoniae]|uniref:Phosphotransferase n=1 Tax=Lichenicola cladoniae TaxID=1484109 RepID=A0A6M8HRV9_9PROT|nr:phosphotransferase [Lichenicola cladoniae]NPD65743.1 phosphotransferase [Acetobacteraceae bacterium]QKE91239.1 phosphotransferase [Lichenicola cladoniae]
MLDRAGILSLIPHGGASCLLDRVEAWSPGMVRCTTLAHLDPGNVLRRAGRLGTICGVEMGLQAAALHGAMCGGKAPSRPGYLASLRAVQFATGRLDDPGHGMLTVTAILEHGDERALAYGFDVQSATGASLVSGRAIVVLQAGS